MSVKKAIILGSGLSVFEDKEPLASIKYEDIPSWPVGKVKGHKGVLDKYEDVWVLRGRAHIYEGFSWQQACFPTQYLADHGIEELIITNAAGGIDKNFEIGDLMQITGYLNFMEPTGKGKLAELTQEVTRFKTTEITNDDPEIKLHKGVYVGVHGPTYETHSEISMFKTLGASAVGMSTIPEIQTALKNDLKVTAVSIITNVYGKTADLGHEGVVVAAKEASAKLLKLLKLA
jgi:purine-nucleoside phosphorylase